MSFSDPTPWFRFDLPNVGGDRTQWGNINNVLWQAVDNMFAGVPFLNNKWAVFASNSDTTLFLSTSGNNRFAALKFGPNGQSSNNDQRWALAYDNNSRDFTIARHNTSGIFQNAPITLEANGDTVFRSEKAYWDADEIKLSSPTQFTALRFATALNQNSDRERVSLVYEGSSQKFYIQTHDANGNFVANAIIIEANGRVTIPNLK